ncbi:xanthine dehydrogenase family protein molybdopterin-binding subunit [Rhodoplanes sp. Z2-YC6860]|uniref:xanthine dehydrogenase family protein molybdopterin-binding subunit n=1 Tax=Rhodoplanes sp. Z2-YC6860 TaxID=674703 RepID=UPI00078B718C|nr:xanthine dehydrogenase family protein molybdopterin-binding subunit [Rhodoplanes sp. Z2-YC6860]AMN44186.1 xanthine dehydrogenase, molybdenum binding subunit apoprotein [Rhodoplanes sp. Z2-YC6860]
MIEESIPRLEDAPLLVGAGRFVDDIALPGSLHACFLRSAHGHALVRRIDTAVARSMDGVVAVYSFADIKPFLTEERLVVALPSKAFRQQVDRPVLAIDEVVYVGEPVAVVIAGSRHQAEDALTCIEVEYEPLEAVVDCVAAVVPGTATVHRGAPHNIVAELDLTFGNAGEAFGGAAHVYSERLLPSRGGSHSIEGRGVVASYDANQDLLTVWSSTQTPHAAMRMLAHMLGREEKSVRVVAPDVGGGFGPKLVFYSEELVVALAALLLRRPVKWIEDRREHFISTTQERDQVWDLQIAVDDEARILGIRGSMIHDHGAYTARGVNVAFEAMQAMTMPYNVPACSLQVKLALTNKVPVTPVRGAGQPLGVFAMERLLDRVAMELKFDRADVRRRNLVRREQMPCPKPFKTRSGVPVVIDSGDLHACQDEALSVAGWTNFPSRKREARAKGRHLGIGLANFVELTGRGPFEPATVKITSSGKIHVLSSAAAMGQSTKTMLAQIAAAQLGNDMSNVIVTTGDSATSTIGFGGFGSRQTVTAGSSAHIAALKVREKVLAVAGHLLEVAPTDLEISGGDVHLKGAAGLKIGLAEVAKASLGVAGAYLPAGLPPGMEFSEAFVVNEMAYSNGTAVAVVEVDVETGGVTIRDYVLAHDCGRVINPMIVDGQVVGGTVHGIGNALLERMHFDASGQPLTTTLAEYLLPTSTDVPSVRLVHRSTPSPLNPLGVKGVGESGVLPAAAAIVGAIEDALSDLGARISIAPVGPAEIVEIVRRGSAKPLNA